MFTLQFQGRHNVMKAGTVVHLRILENTMTSPGRWRITAQDITPLEGAEPTGYACGICGVIEAAKPDGSLPEGWIEKKYEQGSMFICRDGGCQDEPVCRVCGCTNESACQTPEGPCRWVEPDLCSACSTSK